MSSTLATRQNGVGSLAAASTLSFDDALPSQHMMDFCAQIAQSNLVPKDFRGRPADILIAVQMGREVGLKPIQALHSIAVINGRPSLWGDGALAVIRGRNDCADVKETIDGESDKRTATCTIVRAGSSPVTRTFSIFDAKRAKLFDKDGPWKQYPDRMLQMRARGFAMRDAFPDALKGFAIAEEAMDIPVDESGETPPPAPTRTEQVLNKMRTVTATVNVPEDAPPVAQEAAQTTEPTVNEAQLRKDLRKAIGTAWQHVPAEKRSEVLTREFAKGTLLDLTTDQLNVFLEDTPRLLEEIGAEAPAE